MCPSESDLIRLIAGELDARSATAVAAHAESCDKCRRCIAGLQATWEMMGEWEVAPPPRDMTVALLVAASHHSSRQRLRIAAAVLLAMGAGVAIGTAIPAAPPALASVPDSEAVADSLGLDALSIDQGGFAWAIEAAPTGEEERS